MSQAQSGDAGDQFTSPACVMEQRSSKPNEQSQPQSAGAGDSPLRLRVRDGAPELEAA
jgi:hypothetical protein